MVLIVFSVCIFILSASGKHQLNMQDPWKAPACADSLINPYMIEPLTLPLGEEIYNLYCSSCHGDKGLGNGSAGNSLKIKSANFHDKDIQNQSDGALYWKLTKGRGSSMPSFKEVLTDEQRWQLVAYIRDMTKPFCKQQNPFKTNFNR